MDSLFMAFFLLQFLYKFLNGVITFKICETEKKVDKSETIKFMDNCAIIGFIKLPPLNRSMC